MACAENSFWLSTAQVISTVSFWSLQIQGGPEILGQGEQQHKTGPEGKSSDLSKQGETGGSCHMETLICLRGSGNPQCKSWLKAEFCSKELCSLCVWQLPFLCAPWQHLAGVTRGEKAPAAFPSLGDEERDSERSTSVTALLLYCYANCPCSLFLGDLSVRWQVDKVGLDGISVLKLFSQLPCFLQINSPPSPYFVEPESQFVLL